MIGIVNASPLIYLGKIGAINLLPKLFDYCFTTTMVKNEVLDKESAPEYLIIEQSFSEWLTIRDPQDQILINRLTELNIHQGEASIIALAKEMQERGDKNIIIIDDMTARELARTLELRVTGTLGIILRALYSNFISKAETKDFLKFLIEETSFRLSASLYVKILEEINDFNPPD